MVVDRLKQIPVETGEVPKPPVIRKKAGESDVGAERTKP
jgi:hypothetical protein